jgi:cellulose synthase/poly-beta-1,6-N-acetylglucosamine synthase-like glycosyltransferase
VRCVAVIPAHAADRTIERTIRALRADPDAAPDRIVVVASPADASAAVAERLGADTIRTPRRLSAGAARNVGRRAAPEAELVLFVDADCALAAGSMRALRSAVVEHGLDVAGASIVPEPSTGVAWIRHLLEFKDAEPGCAPPWPSMVPSATILCRVQAFDAIGGFPDMWPGEDLVFCARLARSGFRVRRLDDALTVHHHPPGVRTMLRHQFRLGKTSALARRIEALDDGRFATSAVAVPLLFVGRAARALRWLGRHHRRDIPRFVVMSPLYLAGLAAWCSGFARGSVETAA